jgi:hypothetical protein
MGFDALRLVHDTNYVLVDENDIVSDFLYQFLTVYLDDVYV